ncbi:hypothetical protein [Geobacillus thermodenitrificans]|nr:hypothetical protein [Geobacillus thermodenitrificans]MED4916611.1 hypothetical protein [Geobacillus thermodenitrificans]
MKKASNQTSRKTKATEIAENLLDAPSIHEVAKRTKLIIAKVLSGRRK